MKTRLLILLGAGILSACGPGIQELEQEPVQLASEMEVDENPFVVREPDSVPESLNPVAPVATPAWLAFKINPSRAQLALGPGQFWEGCSGEQFVKGGYDSDSVCGRAYFHPRFAEVLNKDFLPCVRTAASAAGLPRPERVFLRHFGSYNNRNARGSSVKSMHAYARALDIVNFNLVDAAGKTTRVSTHVRDYKGKAAVFYDRFRSCWSSKMPAKCKGQREGSGSIGHPESLMGGNTLHNDHIHLSYPLCAG